MTKQHLSQLAEIQMEISTCALCNGHDSSKVIELMEKHLGIVDNIIAFEVRKIIPDLPSGWGPGYSLEYLTEEYIRRIAERQVGLLQATEQEDKEKMALAQVAYFTTIENIIQIEVSKAITLQIKFANIKTAKQRKNGN